MLNRRDNKDKNKDKPPPDPHREFLDAESTDEEERRKIYEKNIKRLSSLSLPFYTIPLSFRLLLLSFRFFLLINCWTRSNLTIDFDQKLIAF